MNRSIARAIVAALSLSFAAPLTGCGGAAGTIATSATPPASGSSGATSASKSADSSGARAPSAPASTDASALALMNSGAAAPQNEPFELFPSRSHGRNEPRRPSISPIPLRISSLPTAFIRAPLEETAATAAAFEAGMPTTELVVRVTDRPLRSDYMQAVVSSPTAAFSAIKIGTWVGWGGGPYARDAGAFITCSPRYSGILPARWQTLAVKDDAAELTVTDGWFNQATCKASIVQRATVKAVPLFGGPLVFAFHQCGATCAEREELTLIFPRSQNLVSSAVGGESERGIGSFSMVSLPIRRGGGGSMMARIPNFEIHSFRKSAGLAAKAAPDAAKDSPENKGLEQQEAAAIFFGVEVTQSIEDPEPFAITYIGPENAMEIAASFGVGHVDVGLSAPADVGPGCACQPGDALCSCL